MRPWHGRVALGLDVRALANALVAEQSPLWPGPQVDRIVYCTARISSAYNASGAADQDVYLKALLAANSVDHIEYGTYISKVIKRPLATENSSKRPVLTTPNWPVMVQLNGQPVPDAVFMASVVTWEEKGSDVNVASHLLVDVTSGAIDAAVVISNDSRDAHIRHPLADPCCIVLSIHPGPSWAGFFIASPRHHVTPVDQRSRPDTGCGGSRDHVQGGASPRRRRRLRRVPGLGP